MCPAEFGRTLLNGLYRVIVVVRHARSRVRVNTKRVRDRVRAVYA